MMQNYPHAIITGGSSGIGKAIALRLARQGANVSIIARNAERLDKAQHDIEQAVGPKQEPEQQVVAVSADVSDRPQAERAIQEAIAQLGPPRWLITCAGIARPGYFQEMPIEVFEQTMAINYFGTLYCVRAALPALVAQGQGHVAMVSSGAGLVGVYGYSAYCPSKFALRGLAETLRAELKSMGVGVSITYPPDTDTPQLAEENKTKPPATKKITATADVWSADGVAHVILNGIGRGQFAITPGLEMGVLHRLHSVIAPLLNRYFDRIVARHPTGSNRSEEIAG
ncbi:MAG: SDR family oxidoreductase [Elainellaceae cyanobacterium]